MPTYETLYIAQPEMPEAEAEALGKSFEELVSSGEGTLMKSAAWGKRKLAYPVKKNQEGLYFYLQYEVAPDVVHEMERRMRNHEGVLKYLSVRLDRIALETLAAADKKAEERAAARAVREAERAERQKLAEEESAAAAAKAAAEAPAEPAPSDKKETAPAEPAPSDNKETAPSETATETPSEEASADAEKSGSAQQDTAASGEATSPDEVPAESRVDPETKPKEDDQ